MKLRGARQGLAVLGALAIVGLAMPAFADDHHDRDRHERHVRHDDHRRGPAVAYSPGYYAPPPPVYYTPPPPPVPSLNVVIPLRF